MVEMDTELASFLVTLAINAAVCLLLLVVVLLTHRWTPPGPSDEPKSIPMNSQQMEQTESLLGKEDPFT